MNKEKYVAYVGTYTHGSSIGIHLYDLNVEEGTMKERKVIPVNNSSHIAKSKNGKYLYSIADEGVAVFSIAPDGDLTFINQVDIDGMRGCHLSTDVDGKYLFVSGYHDGKVTVVHTHRDGRLGSVMDGVFHRGLGSVAERNFRPHVSCVRPTPDNKYLCAVDNGIDQIKIYRINDRTHKLELVDVLRCKRESAPRNIKFSKDGRFAYVIYELANTIEVYSYDGNGKLPQFERLQEISVLAATDDEKHDAASGICLSPDGSHLFCSTAGEDTVGMFEVDPASGLLEKRFVLPISGEYPKDLEIFPDGKHIAVANHASNTITTFTIDYDKNILVMKGKPLKVETPNCILISKIEESPVN
ncbi:lactonase family protein [Lactonifactor longoviformis]|uniref:6-phosphogluconolactonase n=1 Tax=Lactonifactor longoviformis DSM 17459 TaxID=1122155 RepID=A0A1M4SX48_9CLOT|nr:lactonase family protein [Lactonifactor longoviformis]POP33645.1 lactonase family protein [Lactonifactor longoviformis]SHE36813.1 6-phosphogluconolactonase [Lactonifactor longoviformis DSM 17459]